MCVCFIQLNKAVQCWAQHLCIDCSLCCWESNSSSPADDAPCQQTHNNGSSGPPPPTHTHAQWQWMFWEWIAAVTKLVCSMQLSTNNTHTQKFPGIKTKYQNILFYTFSWSATEKKICLFKCPQSCGAVALNREGHCFGGFSQINIYVKSFYFRSYSCTHSICLPLLKISICSSE